MLSLVMIKKKILMTVIRKEHRLYQAKVSLSSRKISLKDLANMNHMRATTPRHQRIPCDCGLCCSGSASCEARGTVGVTTGPKVE